MFAARLRELFPDLAPRVDDLYLLEAHQVSSLQSRAPWGELAAVLHAHPGVRRYPVARRHRDPTAVTDAVVLDDRVVVDAGAARKPATAPPGRSVATASAGPGAQRGPLDP
jgi:hypothetical protein